MQIKVHHPTAQIFIDSHAGFLKKHLSNKPLSYYNDVRQKLNGIRQKGSKKDAIVMAFIEVVKRYQEASGYKPLEGYLSKKHILTDHAFCSALARMYGVDILKVKDRVVEDIGKNNVRHVLKDGLIITVLGAD